MRKYLIAILATAALVGCGSPLKTEGPKKVDDLVGSIEQVYVEAELCRDKSSVAMDKLQRIAAAEFKEGDAALAYAEFVQALDESMKQAEVMKAAIEPMKNAADPIFSGWEADMKEYSSESMRERSRARMERTRHQKLISTPRRRRRSSRCSTRACRTTPCSSTTTSTPTR